MRIDRGLAGWGLFLILVGAIPLAATQGWIPSDIPWWSLWPLVVIGIGLAILLRRTPLGAIGGLLVAGTMGVIIGGTLATGVSGGIPFTGCAGSSSGPPFADQVGGLTEPSVGVELEMGCGDLTVAMADGTGWTLRGSSDDGVVPIIDTGPDRLDVRTPEGVDFFGDKSSWQVTLPRDPTIDLSASVNAGSGDLDLAGARLAGATVEVNAGSADVDLSTVTSMTGELDVSVNAGSASITLPTLSIAGELEVNAGSMEICSPPGAGLRLRTTENLTASYDYDDAGLVEVSDGVWETPGFAGSSTMIDLSTTANAGSFSLNPEDGCQ
jgi:hypothetical protein